ncbi:MAG: hypothetical protein IJ766_05900 [Clostridia bacterium]|nr:hypothetical protein [Clostridia bacterium]
MHQKIIRSIAVFTAAILLVAFFAFFVFAKSEADLHRVIADVTAQMAVDCPAPTFSPIGGEWTVICLARSGYYPVNDRYFNDYYQRVVASVNTVAPTVAAASGALHRAKSTDNARLILALSAIGKDPRAVGNWDIVAPYEDFSWVQKQGINGVAYALLALDSADYETTDPSIRRQCVSYILERQLPDGGWALTGDTADTDVTGMVLQALANYRDDEAVVAAADRGIACLARMQDGGGFFATRGVRTAESSAQAIVALCAWGVDANTDARFVKNGVSALSALMRYYIGDAHAFCHTLDDEKDEMATDQACYALIAYDRFFNGDNFLYDMSDVTGLPAEMGTTAILLPAQPMNAPATIKDRTVSIPRTGDDFADRAAVAAVLAVSSLCVVLALFSRRRKDR